MIRNTTEAYGLVSKILHWLMAITVILLIILGYLLEDLKDPFYYKIHKSTGFLFLILAIVRFLWRMSNPIPNYNSNVPKIISMLAHLGHYTLYLLMFLVPFSAFISSNASQRPISFLYMFDMPSIFSEKNMELAKDAMNAHKILITVLIGMFVLHVLGALYHHFIIKDNVLNRMLPEIVSRRIS